MPARQRKPPTPVLNSLSGVEHSGVLAELLASHPDLLPEAELIARRRLVDVTVEDVADDVAWALAAISDGDLAGRSGRIRGRGYVDVHEAASELLSEAIDPFLIDMRRRASSGLADAATVIATGIKAGLYEAREPGDGTVVAFAGPDELSELAAAVIREATRLGLVLPPDAADRYWPEW